MNFARLRLAARFAGLMNFARLRLAARFAGLMNFARLRLAARFACYRSPIGWIRPNSGQRLSPASST